jgi:hypothetical protein
MEDPDPYLSLMVRMRIREAQKHMDPTDPDPQHCYNWDFDYFKN